MSMEEVRSAPKAGIVGSSPSTVDDGRSDLRSLVSGSDNCWRTEGKEGRLADEGCLYRKGVYGIVQ